MTDQLAAYRRDGYVVLAELFPAKRISALLADVEQWQQTFLAALTDAERTWYLDRGTERPDQLRKIDQPVSLRPSFRAVAETPALTAAVRTLLGADDIVCVFSQLFFKPPEGGGPKPAHQDNFYFGPADPEGMVTAWLALDDATPENGCLHYWTGSHRGGVLPHTAPADEPFNLQVAESAIPARYPKTCTPVASGGVSFHHGFMVHQSGNNLSPHFRRAVAMHYMRADTALTTPALPYDDSHFLAIP
jgi:ectoine hydroxylase-related dioxygenase (phytanoyl-CoA dioxygenase family)